MNRFLHFRSTVDGAPRRRALEALALGAILAAAAAPALAATPPATAPAPAAAASPASSSSSDKSGMVMSMVGDKLDGMLTKIGATDDQKTKVKAALVTAVGQLMGMAPEMKQVPKQFEAALTGPTVDRALLEKTRVQLIANLDQGSKVLTNALADAAEALTPEQRAKLAAMFAPKAKVATHATPDAPPAKP